MELDPSIQFKIFLYLVIVISAVFHEFSHGWVANYLGDPTARYAGRLTLNPLKHIDPIGTVIVPLSLLFFFGGFIGWAKPVPYNPYNLRERKYGSAKVGAAGPAANILIALIFGLALRLIPLPVAWAIPLTWIVYVNVFLALFNLIPIPPLDGSKLLMDFFPRSRILQALEQSFIGIFIAIILAIMILPFLASLIFYLIVGGAFPSVIF